MVKELKILIYFIQIIIAKIIILLENNKKNY